MSIWLKRSLLAIFLFLGAAALMVQCTTQSASKQYANGLTCQSYTTSSSEGLDVTKGSDCRFKCPDGRLLSLPQAVVSQSKDQLNFLFCGVQLPSPTANAGTASANISPTAPLVSPLAHTVGGCDLVAHVLNFTFVQPTPDLTGKTLTVDVQGQQTQCSIPPGMPGTYSCKIPPGISFPAGIVIKVNGQVVDLFPFAGFGCYTGEPTRAARTPTAKAPATASSQPPTQQPTSQPPTQPPATQPQPTQPPATQPPATQQPTQAPATDSPTQAPAPTSPPATAAPSPGFPFLPGLFDLLAHL